MKDIVHVAFLQLNGDPVPGVPDPDLNPGGIVARADECVVPIQSRRGESRFGKSRFLASDFGIRIAPILKQAEV